MPTLAELLQRRAMPQGMLSSGPMAPTAPPMPMPAGIPFGAGRQQLTPQQLEMLMKMLGTSQPAPFTPIQTSGTRG
jgi:hypothetical protein